MNKKLLSALVGAVVLTGCSSNDKVPTLVTERTLVFEQDNRRYIHSIATTEYGNEGLGGAAVLQPATIHVMSDERRTAEFEELKGYVKALANSNSVSKADQKKLYDALKQLERTTSESDQGVIANNVNRAMLVLASIQSTDTKTHLSHYDLDLWDKFCSDGDAMTEDDWGQMLSSSIAQIPDPVQADCNIPDLSLTEDITDRHCEGVELSNREQFIIQEHGNPIACPH
ncbi:hypothetical protein [Marinobacter sp. F3R08]|uniref:hypothetical protein n=1 Tax=Marinobacter sp. F3R08 TaxID=2841559 RepID=UPI001C09DD54|nr:hypothetical protein [Marinobacter sp. F3R08]MBU2952228.1 hypothetical protein [Marinobacter sp. F3R08]